MSASERFAVLWTPEPNTGCWLWTGDMGVKYGRIQIAGHRLYAHRASWILHRGPIPSWLLVLHRCDTPGCVNPDHLWLGTQADNMRDCAEKGRAWNPLARAHASATHCPQGHEYAGDNLYVWRGQRGCRTCRNKRHGKRMV